MSQVKANNYVYQSRRTEKSPQGSHKKRCLVMAVFGAFLVIVVILLWIEKSMENKLIVHNKSSHHITELRFWYEDESGGIIELMDFGAVGPKEKLKNSTEDLALSELAGNAYLSVHIAFEDGGQALLQSGQFLHGFDGRISFEVADTRDEELMIRLKAGEGLFNSTVITGCDDVYYINPKDGYIE